MDGTLNRLIGANIRERRLALGMTLKDLGDELQVSYQQVQKYEKGTNSVPAEKLVAVAKFFVCSIDEVCGVKPSLIPLQIMPLICTAASLPPELLTKFSELLATVEATSMPHQVK